MSISYNKLGDLEYDDGNDAVALDWYKKALVLFQQLVDKSPDNVELQKYLEETQEKIAQLQNQS